MCCQMCRKNNPLKEYMRLVLGLLVALMIIAALYESFRRFKYYPSGSLNRQLYILALIAEWCVGILWVLAGNEIPILWRLARGAVAFGAIFTIWKIMLKVQGVTDEDRDPGKN